MLYKYCSPEFAQPNKPCYQPVKYFIYWSEFGIFNNWNIITFSNKNATSEEFDDINQIFLDNIRENVVLMLQSGHDGAMNTIDPKKGLLCCKVWLGCL